MMYMSEIEIDTSKRVFVGRTVPLDKGQTGDFYVVRDNLVHKLLYEHCVLNDIMKRRHTPSLPMQQWELNVLLEAFVLHWTNIVQFLVNEHERLVTVVPDVLASPATMQMRERFRDLLRSPSKHLTACSAPQWGCSLPMVDFDSETRQFHVALCGAKADDNNSVYSNLRNSILVEPGRSSVKFRVSWNNMCELNSALMDLINASYFLPNSFCTSDGCKYALYETLTDDTISQADPSQ